jgi:hypothetical protein
MKRVAVSVAAGALLLAALPGLSLADPPGTLDQSQNTGTATIGTTADVYQTFTVGITGTLTGVQVYMNGDGSATATVAIQSTTGGNPSLTDIVSTASVVPAADGLVDFTFSTGVSVTSGDVLAIRINTGASTAAWGSSSDAYVGGQAMWLNGGWQAVPNMADFRFQTFVQTGAVPDSEPTATPPPTSTAPGGTDGPGPEIWLLSFGMLALTATTLVATRRSYRVR